MFKLPELPYGYGDLGPHISKEVMELHYSKHHQTYIDNLNKALDNYDELKGLPVDNLLSGLDSLPEEIQLAVRNNGGGHYNHSLFWQWMSPRGSGQPGGELEKQLVEKYGSFQGFVDEFSKEALTVFGSGWVWLNEDLTISKSANQDSPLLKGSKQPLLGLDVWEHAYYLDYQNRRADYVKAWWHVVNWGKVSS